MRRRGPREHRKGAPPLSMNGFSSCIEEEGRPTQMPLTNDSTARAGVRFWVDEEID